MLDVLTRIIRHPIDYAGVFRTTDLALVEKIDEGNGVFSFVLTADTLPTWKAGQHAIFTLPGKPVEGKTWRPFSVASAPREGVIRIGTIIPETPSSFKHHLAALTPGEKVRMYGPFGSLYLKSGMTQVVAVAGGIGITPFRAIVSDLAVRQSPIKLHLVYSAKESHTYRKELDAWTAANANVTVNYTHTPEEVDAELERQVAVHGNEAHYFLSGAPGMIDALRRALRARRVKRSRIIHDPFKGY